MDNWKFQLFLVVFCVLVQIYQGLCFSVEKERWISKDWQDESMETSVVDPGADLMKRSKALRFYGLMGKRTGVKQPIQMDRRGKKGEMFVGLMGRSISTGESLTQIIPAATSASRERDLQEERARLRDR